MLCPPLIGGTHEGSSHYSAYNEEMRIGNVLAVLERVPLVDEIIVVSDGSEDNTVDEALKYNVTVIALPRNIGKSKQNWL